MKDYFLSIIMPCYMEEDLIYKNLFETIDIVSNIVTNFEIIVIDDGSIDNSKTQIEKAILIDDRIKLISYRDNKGKGNALKVGTEVARGDLVVFLDSDLELSPTLIDNFIKIMEAENADVVIGSKMHPLSEIDYPITRKIMSLGYYTLLRMLFKLKVKDTQTGIKLFKAEIIRSVMPKIIIEKFAFDIEVLSIINRRGYKIVDAPIKLKFVRDQNMGRIKLVDIYRTFIDTFAIYYRLKILKYYD